MSRWSVFSVGDAFVGLPAALPPVTVEFQPISLLLSRGALLGCRRMQIRNVGVAEPLVCLRLSGVYTGGDAYCRYRGSLRTCEGSSGGVEGVTDRKKLHAFQLSA